MEEIWKVIQFNGRFTNYSISNLGRVSGIRKDFITPVTDKDGYLVFSLHLGNGYRVTAKIHRLVAEAFIPNPENKPEVNHKDGNKANPHVLNLEWSTGSENVQHAFDTGIRGPSKYGSTHEWAKHSEDEIRKVCSLLIKGTPIDDISKICGIPKADISNIRNGKIWKSVSCEFDIPRGVNYKGEPLMKYSKELKRDVSILHDVGFKNADIMRNLNLPQTKETKWMIKDVVRRNRNYFINSAPTTI